MKGRGGISETPGAQGAPGKKPESVSQHSPWEGAEKRHQGSTGRHSRRNLWLRAKWGLRQAVPTQEQGGGRQDGAWLTELAGQSRCRSSAEGAPELLGRGRTPCRRQRAVCSPGSVSRDQQFDTQKGITDTELCCDTRPPPPRRCRHLGKAAGCVHRASLPALAG